MLLTDGNAVSVDNRPAVYRQPIRQNDWVATGAGASALIRFSNGTVVQLDEQTDPVHFSWTQTRLEIRMDDAVIQVNNIGGFIVDVIGGLAEFFSWSDVVVEEHRSQFFRADLFSGRMQLKRPRTGPVQGSGQYVTVWHGRANPEYGYTSPQRASQLKKRFERWNFAVPPRPTVSGICCSNGKLSKSTSTECTNLKGEFFTDLAQAKRYCAVTSGYCCRNGTLSRSTSTQCLNLKGEFSTDLARAKRYCAVTSGYCCSNGRLSKSTSTQCANLKGKFFTDLAEAKQYCVVLY